MRSAPAGFSFSSMPRNLIRYHHSGQSHFVTFSCYRRQPKFDAASTSDLFLTCLERTRRRFRLYVYGYVVMPEHVHLTGKRARDRMPGRRGSRLETDLRPPVDQARAGRILAETLLRPQRARRRRVRGEAALYSSQSGEARTSKRSRRLEVEQLSSLRVPGNRSGGDRIGLDGTRPRKGHARRTSQDFLARELA